MKGGKTHIVQSGFKHRLINLNSKSHGKFYIIYSKVINHVKRFLLHMNKRSYEF